MVSVGEQNILGENIARRCLRQEHNRRQRCGHGQQAEPFGLSMTDFRQWNRLKSAKSNALIGIVRESPNPTTAQRLIDYLSA